MRTIILSIQPKWATLIRSGEKTIELRRRFPRYLAGYHAYVYETSPNCKLVAIVQMGEIHELPIEELWSMHGKASCVSERHFATYFHDRDVGYGIEITRYFPLSRTWELGNLRKEFSFTAPQSWAYASPQFVSAVGTPL